MANKFHGDSELPIRLDRTRHICFDYKAGCKFRKAAGVSIQSVLKGIRDAIERFPAPVDEKELSEDLINKRAQALIDAVDEDIAALLLWAGLVHEDPTLTPDEVEEICEQAEGRTMGQKKLWIIGKVTEAINLANGITSEQIEEMAKKKIRPEAMLETTKDPSSVPASS